MKSCALLIMSAILLCVSSAAAQWTPSGVPVCTDSSSQTGPSIVTDGSGGAIIMWMDMRDVLHQKAFLQRVDATGTVRWPVDGIPAGDTTHTNMFWGMIADGAGGAIITWTYTASFKADDIFAQRISASGASLWTHDGIPVCTAAREQNTPRMISDGAQGAVITWEDSRIYTQYTYAQHIGANGSPLWAVNGIAMSAAGGSERMQTITPDDAGGAIIAWADYRSGAWDIYAQRVTSGGTLLWGANGTPVCTASGSQTNPLMVPDGAHGAIVVWDDRRNDNHDIFSQRIDADGNILWATEGVSVSTAADDQMYERVLRDGSGGIIVVWQDYRSGGMELYAQRMNQNGKVLWETDGRSLGIGEYLNYSWRVTSDGAGGMIFVWTDDRLGGNVTYAQRFDENCLPLWTPGGIPVCLASRTQKAPTLTSDLAGGAIVAWQDCRREDCYDYYYDIYVQHLNSDDGIIATLLQSFSANRTEAGIAVEWTLSEMGSDIRFSVLRAQAPAFIYAELEDVEIEQTDMTSTMIDRSAQAGETYRYRVDVVDASDRKTLFETDGIEVPALPPMLFQNYPNPFNPSTMVSYYLPERCEVRLSVFDVSGTLVRVLDDGIRERGTHAIPWAGRGSRGAEVASGIYFYRLDAGAFTQTRKMILLR